MAVDWKRTTLGAIATKNGYGLVDGPFGSNLPASAYTQTGVPVIRGSNLALGTTRFRSDEFVYVSEESARTHGRSLCRPGDIVFTKKGTIGQTGFVPYGGRESLFLLSSNQMKLTVDSAIADPLFVYYHVSAPESVEKIIRDSEATGVPKTNVAYLRDFPILLPPLADQKAIAAILGTLDDKIELNRQMNATLEAMARVLFQSWFVDFDPVRAKLDGRQPPDLDPATAALFPDSFQESSLGPIPDGWEVCSLSDKIQLLSGGTPKTSEPTYWNGDIPWYSVRDAPSETDVWVIHTDKHVTKLGIADSAAQLFPEKTTIISARGTVGKLALTAVPMAMNQSCYGVRGTTGYGDYFTYYSLREATAQLQQRTHGTVFDTITTETFKTLECIFPTQKITTAFDKLVEPLLGQIRGNLRQSRTLATLRDTLLPKLLSGELSVGQAKEASE